MEKSRTEEAEIQTAQEENPKVGEKAVHITVISPEDPDEVRKRDKAYLEDGLGIKPMTRVSTYYEGIIRYGRRAVRISSSGDYEGPSKM